MKKGSKVTDVTNRVVEKGIVKSSASKNKSFVVFNCADNWKNYEDYTASLVNNTDLLEEWTFDFNINNDVFSVSHGFEVFTENKNSVVLIHKLDITEIRITCETDNNSFYYLEKLDSSEIEELHTKHSIQNYLSTLN